MRDNYREPEDLLSDTSFLSWYFRTGGDDDAKWADWMADRPDREQLVQKALTLLEATRLPEKEPSAQQLQNAENALFGKIASLPPTPKTAAIGRMRWIAAASVLVAVIAGIIIVKYVPHTRPEVRTPFAHISSRQLPDGTEVTMNANSSLRYGNNWTDTDDREVWVNGEAFFHVKKTQSNSRFIVHSEHFDIIVTGTQFNVSNRHGKDNVLLQEGRVTLRTKDGKTMSMQPGEFVIFDSSLQKKATDPRILAWREQMMNLDSTPVSQMAVMINDLYGTTVHLEGDSTATRTVTCMLPSNDLDRLIKTLEAAEFDIIRDSVNNEITIREREKKK
jgi:ferric-dicitrate binding protein FerR (iron transport regulator)